MGRNSFFKFKKFSVAQDACAMKVTTDACLFGAWCAQQLQRIQAESILDVGAGTGLLSLMLAQATTASIHAIELEASAAAQAASNFSASAFAHRLQLIPGDVQQMAAANYNVIISNPPFYEQQLKSPVQNKNTAMHCDTLTLQNLLMAVDRLLAPDGQLFLLLPDYRKKELLEALPVFNLFPSKMTSVCTLTNKPPFRFMIAAQRKKCTSAEDELVIRETGGGYTPEFMSLLQPYYLHL